MIEKSILRKNGKTEAGVLGIELFAAATSGIGFV